jgi:GNAT superfamily N-acetyltransferase
VIEADGEIIALVECIREPDHLLIENLAVAPAHQGKGHGRRLMAHAEGLARALGFDQVRLYTNTLFATNVTFYKQLGYRVDVETAFKGGFVVHMSRRI